MRRLPLRSPPRVRGKVPVCCPEHRKVRITPAYAGKRDLVISGSGDIEDHPRVCGEKLKMPCWIAPSVGSPPRMRGKAGSSPASGTFDRITPAYAGKSNRDQTILTTFEDHPRVCGEKDGRLDFSMLQKGSPPRVRGKGYMILSGIWDFRITPACAGKSCLAAIYAYNEGDHPRVCGEKSVPLRCSISAVGSPPRVRGKAWRLPAAPGTQGITPACAGKSGPISASGRAIRDHPRVCGEKALHDGGILPAQGSPPRVRGKVVVSRNLCLLSGITPACAGKSELQALVLSGQRDHPRVCGEKRRKRQSV